ncbi:MAG TPA: flippase, partial [Polymorphobacter sp.]|nr:flippase [Polymorphobacter sp.]
MPVCAGSGSRAEAAVAPFSAFTLPLEQSMTRFDSFGALLHGRPLFAKLLANIGWLVGDKVLRLGVGVLIGAWTARYLGPEQFGAMNYAMAIVTLFTAFATMGLPEILVRDLVLQSDRRRAIMASAFALRIGGGIFTILLVIVAVTILQPGDSRALWLAIIIAIGPLAQAFDIVEVRFQAVNEVQNIVIIRNIAFVVVALLRIVAIIGKAPLIVFALLSSFEFVLAGLLMWSSARRTARDFNLADIDLGECRRLLFSSWPLLLRAIAIGLYLRIDQVLIGQMLGDVSVGIYAAAARVSEIWYMVPVVVMTALVPQLAVRHDQSLSQYEATLVKIMRFLVWGSIVFAVVIAPCAPLIIRLLFGVHYTAATTVLALH